MPLLKAHIATAPWRRKANTQDLRFNVTAKGKDTQILTNLYFAYGSNMDPDRMADRGLRVVSSSHGSLVNLQLTFDQPTSRKLGAGRANITHKRGETVEGVLYALSNVEALVTLDRFEGTPRSYSREIFYVDTLDGRLPAWVYAGNPMLQRPGLKPERWYVEHMLAGRTILSGAYFERLKRVECLP